MKRLLCVIKLKGNRHYIEINSKLTSLPLEKKKMKIDRPPVSKKCS